jgi:hypothetical protein
LVRLLVFDGCSRRLCALERIDLEGRETMEFMVL